MSTNDISNILGGPWTPVDRVIDPPEIQLRNAIIDSGLIPPETIHMDGKLHRFKSRDSSDKKHGWYIVYGDGIPAGSFGCWKSGIDITWHAETGKRLSDAEMIINARRLSEAKKIREEENKKYHEVIANVLDTIWNEAQPANSDHPYLKKKGIQPHGARITGDGRLMFPLYDFDGVLVNIQYVDVYGEKLYHYGGQSNGKCYVIGDMEHFDKIYVGEGFATSATIHETSKQPCFVAYSASNIPNIVTYIKKKYTQEIIIVADNDASGVGQKYANQAAEKFGVKVIVPPVVGDANDYKQAGYDLAELLCPSSIIDIKGKMQVVFGDELSEEFKAPDEIVEGLFTSGSLTVMFGDSNSGKTFLVLSIATAIAIGSDCYQRKTDKGLVIYLASEAPTSVKTRMQALKRYYKCQLENLAMVPVPVNFYSGNQDAHDVIDLVKAIEGRNGLKVKLIVADTLSRICAGANENNGQDMAPIMSRFEQVSKLTGAAIMIIHHTGKDQARGSRGWSGIRAHIDTEIEVSDKDGVKSAIITKQRDLPTKGAVINFKLDIVEMGQSKFGGISTTCVAVQDDQERQEKAKPDSKLDGHRKTFERAWLSKEGGSEIVDDLPYLSRSGLKEFLRNEGYSDGAIRNYTSPNYKNGIIYALLSSEIITTKNSGWIMTPSVHAISLIFLKKK